VVLRPFAKVLDILLEEALRHYGDRLISIVVFGSVGRRAARPNSDVDVLLVIDPLPNGRMARMREFGPVEGAVRSRFQAAEPSMGAVDLSPVFKTPLEVQRGSLLFLDMVHDSVVLFDRGDFFARYLDELRARLDSMGARRIPYRGSWYWDLKDDLQPGVHPDLAACVNTGV